MTPSGLGGEAEGALHGAARALHRTGRRGRSVPQ